MFSISNPGGGGGGGGGGSSGAVYLDPDNNEIEPGTPLYKFYQGMLREHLLEFEMYCPDFLVLIMFAKPNIQSVILEASEDIVKEYKLNRMKINFVNPYLEEDPGDDKDISWLSIKFSNDYIDIEIGFSQNIVTKSLHCDLNGVIKTDS